MELFNVFYDFGCVADFFDHVCEDDLHGGVIIDDQDVVIFRKLFHIVNILSEVWVLGNLCLPFLSIGVHIVHVFFLQNFAAFVVSG